MTDKERIKILEKVKKRIEIGDEDFICNAINNVIRCWSYSNMFELFPEMEKHKPKGALLNLCWFPAGKIKPRIKVLNSMITEIKSKQ